MKVQELVFENLHAVPFVCGYIDNNTFVIYDDESKDCVVIDPSFSFDRVLGWMQEHGLKPREYWLTHAHYDHILGMAYPEALELGVPSRLHPADEVLYKQAKASMAQAIPMIVNTPAPRMDLEDGMTLNVGPYEFKVLFTPGHAPGHCCFYCEKAGWLFSGDLVFYQSYGRTDLTGGNFETLMKSIREKILTLPPETLIMPGHEDYTCVRDEKVFY